jgi:hypothetical protein
LLTLVNVGENTTLGDGNVSEKLVQFLIVSDGKLEMTGNDTGLLVVTSGVSSKLENFGSEVLKDGSQVDGSTLPEKSALDPVNQDPDWTYQHQRAERSCPCAEDGEHDRRGKPDQPWKND